MEKFKNSYLVVGFKNKNQMATFYKEYQTLDEAEEVFEELKTDHERVVLWKEEKYIYNNDNLDISSSSPIKTFEL